MESPDDIVGHKTFDTGERGEDGFPIFRHEPLTRAEGDALWAACEAAEKRRNELMPDEKAAIKMMMDAHTRLKDFGWREPQYCPKEGTRFNVIELGSTGIFEGEYRGEWPDGTWYTYDEHDVYPSSIAPAMFKLFPADEEKRKQRMAEAGARYRASLAHSGGSEHDSID